MTWNKDANMTPTTGGTTWDPSPPSDGEEDDGDDERVI